MNFEDAKDEIKHRLDIVEVIGQYVRLEKSGQRYKGLCPFHQEKTPSFTVHPEHQFYYCFGCGEHGDVFSFVMQRDGLSFPEAVRRLAKRAGVQIEDNPLAEKKRRRRELLERANEVARDHFRRTLFKHPAAEHARSYIAGRGFSREMIDRFQIGFALDEWDDMLNTLASEGINPEMAEEAGLVKPSDRGGHYDTFRNRVIFPITDTAGRVIGFGGRALDPENPAKYLNSPETPLFRKRRSVYAIDVARDAIVSEKRAVIVEGYTDVVSLHQAGIENTVAALGTALTTHQLELLGRYADEVVLVYDSDAAGARAALKNLEVVEGAEIAATLVVLPENTDPDEFVRENGAQAFRDLLDDRISPIEYQLRMVFEEHADRGPDGAADAARDAVDILMRIDDWPRRDEFVARAADIWGQGDPGRTESMTRVLKFEMNRRMRGEQPRSRGPSPNDPGFISETLTRAPAGLMRAETELLAQALEDPETAFEVVARLQPDDMVNEADGQILRALQDQIAENGAPDPEALVNGLPEEGGARARCVELTVVDVAWTAREDEDVRRAQTQETIRRLRVYRCTGGAQEAAISEVSDDDDEDVIIDNFQQLQRRVAEGLDSGELGPDDPIVVKYREACQKLRGSGGRGFVGDAELDARSRMSDPPKWEGRTDEQLAELERSSDSEPRSAADDVSGTRNDSAPDGPPPDDPFAVEEGDPFADEQ